MHDDLTAFELSEIERIDRDLRETFGSGEWAAELAGDAGRELAKLILDRPAPSAVDRLVAARDAASPSAHRVRAWLTMQRLGRFIREAGM